MRKSMALKVKGIIGLYCVQVAGDDNNEIYVGVTEGVSNVTISEGSKKDRTVVKDKSAKLEAKLEREIKQKMVRQKGEGETNHHFKYKNDFRHLVLLLNVLKEPRESR